MSDTQKNSNLTSLEYLRQLVESAKYMAKAYPFQTCILIAVGIELCGRHCHYAKNGNWPDGQTSFFIMAIEWLPKSLGNLKPIKNLLNSCFRNGFCHQGVPFVTKLGNVRITEDESSEVLSEPNCCICLGKMITRLENAIAEVEKLPVKGDASINVGTTNKDETFMDVVGSPPTSGYFPDFYKQP